MCVAPGANGSLSLVSDTLGSSIGRHSSTFSSGRTPALDNYSRLSWKKAFSARHARLFRVENEERNRRKPLKTRYRQRDLKS
jgi:hypothetical protein